MAFSVEGEVGLTGPAIGRPAIASAEPFDLTHINSIPCREI